MKQTLETIENFQQSKNLDELWKKLHINMEQYGISSIFYGIGNSKTQAQDQGIMSAIYYKTSHPKAYREHYDHTYYINDGLSALHCLKHISPFIWHDFDRWNNPTPRQKKFMLDSFEFNMGVGVTVPLRFNKHGAGGIGLSTGNIKAPEFNKTWTSHQDEIINTCYLFDDIARNKHIDDIYHLHKNEQETLCWMAAGYSTTAELAKKMKTTEQIVQNHITSIHKKLKARNNQQAITKALIFNLIRACLKSNKYLITL